MTQGMKLAIDQFFADHSLSPDEVHAGLVEVADYVDGYMLILENAARLPAAADEIELAPP